MDRWCLETWIFLASLPTHFPTHLPLGAHQTTPGKSEWATPGLQVAIGLRLAFDWPPQVASSKIPGAKNCSRGLVTGEATKTTHFLRDDSDGRAGGHRRALPALQHIDPAQMQRLQRVHLLLHRVRGQGGDAFLRWCRVQPAPCVAARGNKPWQRGCSLSHAAFCGKPPDHKRLVSHAVDGAPPGRGALPARPARLLVLQGVSQDRLWHGHRAHARAAAMVAHAIRLLVRLPAAKLPRRQDQPSDDHDGWQHGQARPGAARRGAHWVAAAARLRRSGQSAGGDSFGSGIVLCVAL